jgi:hypothetical protein
MPRGIRAETTAHLMREMGAFCSCCGKGSMLSVDTISPADLWAAHRLARHYWAAYRAGGLQVLCTGCNTSKGHHAISFPFVAGVDILPVHYLHERKYAEQIGHPWVWAAYDYGIDFTIRPGPRSPYRKRKK